VSAERRDREALDLVATRSFAGCAIVDLSLEMLARRMSLSLYGKVRANDDTTYRATLTFFGVEALALDNASGSFPQSVGVRSLETSYSGDDDEDDEGTAGIAGNSGWSLTWKFDGLAYEEHAAVLASLADDF
jgi:hypothetical protein